MPTDTTIIDRLRAIAAANVCDLLNMGDEAHEPPEITWGELDEIGRTAARAAAALTAAHAARDAAKAEAREHEIAKYRAEERANEAIDLLKTRAELAEVAKTGENWPCNACGFGHSATIDAHYEARCAIMVQLAEHERDEARAALTTALRELDEARAALEGKRG